MLQNNASLFIDEEIEVEYDVPPVLEKTPNCPDRFRWQGQTFYIIESLSEWRDYTRRGRSARNMRPSHAVSASSRGSLGVGRFFFKVETQAGRVFVIYYDRAPKNAGHRHGSWYLFQEIIQINEV